MHKLSVELLNVDPAYQRTVKRHVVRKITGKFNWSAFGALLVGKRADGTYWVIDGQQRLAAAKLLGYDSVPVVVIESSGSRHEAELFRQVNGDRQNVSRNELFKAQLEAGDVQSVDIVAVVERCGFTLCFHGGSHSRPTEIRQAAPLEQIYEWGGSELLSRVLVTIHKAWNKTAGATRSFVLTGLGRFFKAFPEADVQRVARCLVRLSPDQLLRHADDARQLLGGSRDQVVSKVVVTQYNKRLAEKNKLRHANEVTDGIEE